MDKKETINVELENVTGGINIKQQGRIFQKEKNRITIDIDPKPNNYGLMNNNEEIDIDISHCGLDGQVENIDDPTGFIKK